MPRLASTALITSLVALALSGCVASAVAGVVTLPVRAAGKAIDLATTSEAEADRNRGRADRKREERIDRLERDYRKHLRQCSDGRDEACDEARADYAELQALRR